jgi:hypothetical protein
MQNLLYVMVNGSQQRVDYDPALGRFRVQGGTWNSLNQSRKQITGTVRVASGSNGNPYACYHCSNCGKPIQAARNMALPGLRSPNPGVRLIAALQQPASFITPLNDGVCWHGGNHC